MLNPAIEAFKASLKERIARGEMYLQNDELYDSASVAQAAAMPAQIDFFTAPIGTGGKTDAQTNLDIPQQLSNNDVGWLREIGIEVSQNAAMADIVNLENLCTFAIYLKKQLFMFGPLSMFPAGSVPYMTAATSLGTAVAVANLGPITSAVNGVPSIHNRFKLGGDGYLLWKNDSFRVSLFTRTGFSLLTTANGGFGLTVKVKFGIVRAREVV